MRSEEEIFKKAKEFKISLTKMMNFTFETFYSASTDGCKTLKHLRDFIDSVSNLSDSCPVVIWDEKTFSDMDAERGISVQLEIPKTLEELNDHIDACERLKAQNEAFDRDLLKRLKEKYEK